MSTLDSLPSVAAHRQTEPARLMRTIRGDLDWIVMKCLEKDRTRRYETASGLAQDVQRHLAGEPILAAPPSAAYRLRKFVRRHKVGVATGLTIAAVLVLGIVGTTIGMLWAVAEAERAERQAERALRAESQATQRTKELEQVAEFGGGTRASSCSPLQAWISSASASPNRSRRTAGGDCGIWA